MAVFRESLLEHLDQAHDPQSSWNQAGRDELIPYAVHQAFIPGVLTFGTEAAVQR